MARKNGTGPMGQGAMSGRGLGFCDGVNSGAYSTGSGRGIGSRSGMGFRAGPGISRRAEMGFRAGNGCRRGSGNALTRGSIDLNDKEILKEQKELLQKRLDTINKQLELIV